MTTMKLTLLAGLLSVLLGTFARPAAAEGPQPAEPAAAPAATTADEVISPVSPRATLGEYLDLVRARRYEDAARYLAPDRRSPGQRAQLARRLKVVLDQHVWLDPDTVSSDAGGDTGDGLSPRLEKVGSSPDRLCSDPCSCSYTD